jgi:ABC-type Mn2+/Zn2+ transport systems, permease components
MALFQYGFMRTAFITGLLLAIITPCIGLVVVLRRQSMIGDALSHVSLAGVAIGLIAGINPLIGALGACVLASFGIDWIRRKFPLHGDLAIAVIFSAGVGLAGVLSGFVPGAANFNSFLFGSIVAISAFEFGLVAVISALVLIAFIVLYRELFLCSLDERTARLSGVPVRLVDGAFSLLTAVTVAIASRTVGVLIVSSLLILPVATAMQLAKSYRQTVILSVLFGVLDTIAGLLISFYADFRPGSTIILVGVAVLLLTILVLHVQRAARTRRRKKTA